MKLGQVSGRIDNHVFGANRQFRRKGIADIKPGKRQRLTVAHSQSQLDRFPLKGAYFAQRAFIVKPGQASGAPEPPQPGKDPKGHTRRGKKGIVANHTNHTEDQPQQDPGVTELGILAGVDVAALAPLIAAAPQSKGWAWLLGLFG